MIFIFILLTCNRQDITNFITIIIIGLVVFFIIIIIIIVFISFISYYDDCDLYIICTYVTYMVSFALVDCDVQGKDLNKVLVLIFRSLMKEYASYRSQIIFN